MKVDLEWLRDYGVDPDTGEMVEQLSLPNPKIAHGDNEHEWAEYTTGETEDGTDSGFGYEGSGEAKHWGENNMEGNHYHVYQDDTTGFDPEPGDYFIDTTKFHDADDRHEEAGNVSADHRYDGGRSEASELAWQHDAGKYGFVPSDVEDCEKCHGNPITDCKKCHGSGLTSVCKTCEGNKMLRHEACGGRGSFPCENCGGDGSLDEAIYQEHPSCEGMGCGGCRNSGLIRDDECRPCRGYGTIPDRECRGGWLDCPTCDGEGGKTCKSCDGYGQRECKKCEGEGDRPATFQDVHHQIWEDQHDKGEYNTIWHYESYGSNEEMHPCGTKWNDLCEGGYKDWEKKFHKGKQLPCEKCGHTAGDLKSKTAHGDNEHEWADYIEDDSTAGFRAYEGGEAKHWGENNMEGNHYHAWEDKTGGWDPEPEDYFIATNKFHDEGNTSFDDRLGGEWSHPEELAWQKDVGKHGFEPSDSVTCEKCDGAATTDCEDCEGSGLSNAPGKYEPCNNCKGNGCDRCRNSGLTCILPECKTCGGTGDKECTGCNGEGSFPATIKDVHHQIWADQHDSGFYGTVWHYHSYGSTEDMEPCGEECQEDYKKWDKDFHKESPLPCEKCGYDADDLNKTAAPYITCPYCRGRGCGNCRSAGLVQNECLACGQPWAEHKETSLGQMHHLNGGYNCRACGRIVILFGDEDEEGNYIEDQHWCGDKLRGHAPTFASVKTAVNLKDLETCPICEGSGIKPEWTFEYAESKHGDKCNACSGSGLAESEFLDRVVEIPKGGGGPASIRELLQRRKDKFYKNNTSAKSDYMKCELCGGSGQLDQPYVGLSPATDGNADGTCPECKGSGIHLEPCAGCGKFETNHIDGECPAGKFNPWTNPRESKTRLVLPSTCPKCNSEQTRGRYQRGGWREYVCLDCGSEWKNQMAREAHKDSNPHVHDPFGDYEDKPTVPMPRSRQALQEHMQQHHQPTIDKVNKAWQAAGYSRPYEQSSSMSDLKEHHEGAHSFEESYVWDASTIMPFHDPDYPESTHWHKGIEHFDQRDYLDDADDDITINGDSPGDWAKKTFEGKKTTSALYGEGIFDHMKERHNLKRTDIDEKHQELGHMLQHRNHDEGKEQLSDPHTHEKTAEAKLGHEDNGLPHLHDPFEEDAQLTGGAFNPPLEGESKDDYIQRSWKVHNADHGNWTFDPKCVVCHSYKQTHDEGHVFGLAEADDPKKMEKALKTQFCYWCTQDYLKRKEDAPFWKRPFVSKEEDQRQDDRYKVCRFCYGEGFHLAPLDKMIGKPPLLCAVCKGSGMEKMLPRESAVQPEYGECPDCDGSGTFEDDFNDGATESCFLCKGAGIATLCNTCKKPLIHDELGWGHFDAPEQGTECMRHDLRQMLSSRSGDKLAHYKCPACDSGNHNDCPRDDTCGCFCHNPPVMNSEHLQWHEERKAHVGDDNAAHHSGADQLQEEHPYWSKCRSCGGDGIAIGSTNVETGEQKQKPCPDCSGLGEEHDMEYWDSNDQLHDFKNYPAFKEMEIPDKELKKHLKDGHEQEDYEDSYFQHQTIHGVTVDPDIAALLMPKKQAASLDYAACANCQGTGTVYGGMCFICNGSGATAACPGCGRTMQKDTTGTWVHFPSWACHKFPDKWSRKQAAKGPTHMVPCDYCSGITPTCDSCHGTGMKEEPEPDGSGRIGYFVRWKPFNKTWVLGDMAGELTSPFETREEAEEELRKSNRSEGKEVYERLLGDGESWGSRTAGKDWDFANDFKECDHCEGTGVCKNIASPKHVWRARGGNVCSPGERCGGCDGSGLMRYWNRAMDKEAHPETEPGMVHQHMTGYEACGACGGYGKFNDSWKFNKCQYCGGSGLAKTWGEDHVGPKTGARIPLPGSIGPEKCANCGKEIWSNESNPTGVWWDQTLDSKDVGSIYCHTEGDDVRRPKFLEGDLTHIPVGGDLRENTPRRTGECPCGGTKNDCPHCKGSGLRIMFDYPDKSKVWPKRTSDKHASLTKMAPYGLPKDIGGDTPELDAKMERCVKKVMAEGHDKVSAIKICKSSIDEKARKGSKTAALLGYTSCPVCKGAGVWPEDAVLPSLSGRSCPICKGSGICALCANCGCWTHNELHGVDATRISDCEGEGHRDWHQTYAKTAEFTPGDTTYPFAENETPSIRPQPRGKDPWKDFGDNGLPLHNPDLEKNKKLKKMIPGEQLSGPTQINYPGNGLMSEAATWDTSHLVSCDYCHGSGEMRSNGTTGECTGCRGSGLEVRCKACGFHLFRLMSEDGKSSELIHGSEEDDKSCPSYRDKRTAGLKAGWEWIGEFQKGAHVGDDNAAHHEAPDLNDIVNNILQGTQESDHTPVDLTNKDEAMHHLIWSHDSENDGLDSDALQKMSVDALRDWHDQEHAGRADQWPHAMWLDDSHFHEASTHRLAQSWDTADTYTRNQDINIPSSNTNPSIPTIDRGDNGVTSPPPPSGKDIKKWVQKRPTFPGDKPFADHPTNQDTMNLEQVVGSASKAVFDTCEWCEGTGIGLLPNSVCNACKGSGIGKGCPDCGNQVLAWGGGEDDPLDFYCDNCNSTFNKESARRKTIWDQKYLYTTDDESHKAVAIHNAAKCSCGWESPDTTMEVCRKCKGVGVDPASVSDSQKPCKFCKGSGIERMPLHASDYQEAAAEHIRTALPKTQFRQDMEDHIAEQHFHQIAGPWDQATNSPGKPTPEQGRKFAEYFINDTVVNKMHDKFHKPDKCRTCNGTGLCTDDLRLKRKDYGEGSSEYPRMAEDEQVRRLKNHFLCSGVGHCSDCMGAGYSGTLPRHTHEGDVVKEAGNETGLILHDPEEKTGARPYAVCDWCGGTGVCTGQDCLRFTQGYPHPERCKECKGTGIGIGCETCGNQGLSYLDSGSTYYCDNCGETMDKRGAKDLGLIGSKQSGNDAYVLCPAHVHDVVDQHPTSAFPEGHDNPDGQSEWYPHDAIRHLKAGHGWSDDEARLLVSGTCRYCDGSGSLRSCKECIDAGDPGRCRAPEATRVDIRCAMCNGDGLLYRTVEMNDAHRMGHGNAPSGPIGCRLCKGSGLIKNAGKPVYVRCRFCKGSGQIKNVCADCEGLGWTIGKNNYEVGCPTCNPRKQGKNPGLGDATIMCFNCRGSGIGRSGSWIGKQAKAQDPYVCECGASNWCASMEHTLEDCDSDCEHYQENPFDASAWCCAKSPADECDGGEWCDEDCCNGGNARICEACGGDGRAKNSDICWKCKGSGIAGRLEKRGTDQAVRDCWFCSGTGSTTNCPKSGGYWNGCCTCEAADAEQLRGKGPGRKGTPPHSCPVCKGSGLNWGSSFEDQFSKKALFDYDPVRDVSPSSTRSAPAPSAQGQSSDPWKTPEVRLPHRLRGYTWNPEKKSWEKDATLAKDDPWPDQADNGIEISRPGYTFDPKLKKWIQDNQMTYPEFGPTFPGVTDINKVGSTANCPDCLGFGRKPKSSDYYELCPACKGKGNGCENCHSTGLSINLDNSYTCTTCGGNGVLPEFRCKKCSGTGTISPPCPYPGHGPACVGHTCSRCKGSGIDPRPPARQKVGSFITCEDCQGAGCPMCDHSGLTNTERYEGRYFCQDCNGTGHCHEHNPNDPEDLEDCPECEGTNRCPYCSGKGTWYRPSMPGDPEYKEATNKGEDMPGAAYDWAHWTEDDGRVLVTAATCRSHARENREKLPGFATIRVHGVKQCYFCGKSKIVNRVAKTPPKNAAVETPPKTMAVCDYCDGTGNPRTEGATTCDWCQGSGLVPEDELYACVDCGHTEHWHEDQVNHCEFPECKCVYWKNHREPRTAAKVKPNWVFCTGCGGMGQHDVCKHCDELYFDYEKDQKICQGFSGYDHDFTGPYKLHEPSGEKVTCGDCDGAGMYLRGKKYTQVYPQQVGDHQADNGIDDPMKHGDPAKMKKVLPKTQQTAPENNAWNVSVDNMPKTGARIDDLIEHLSEYHSPVDVAENQEPAPQELEDLHWVKHLEGEDDHLPETIRVAKKS